MSILIALILPALYAKDIINKKSFVNTHCEWWMDFWETKSEDSKSKVGKNLVDHILTSTLYSNKQQKIQSSEAYDNIGDFFDVKLVINISYPKFQISRNSA